MKHYSLEEWRDLGRAFYDVQLKTDPRQFSAGADFLGAGRMMLTKVSFTPMILAREPRKIREFDSAFLLFERYRRGDGQGILGETATRVDSGTLHLLNMNTRYITSTSHVLGDGVLIPHDLVGFDPSRDPDYVSLRRSTPRARVLEAALDALLAALADGHTKDASDLSDAFAGLVQRLLLGRREDTDLQSADSIMDLALREHIENRLGDPGLDAADLSARFGLSRASLYRRFRDQGGVERYIASRRLDRCLMELYTAPPTRGQVRAIATRWGYVDAGNFNRRFRQRFGVSPRDCLDLGTMFAKSQFDRHQLIHHWMRDRGG